MQSVRGALGGMLADELSSTRQVQARNRGPHPRPLTLEGRHLRLQTVTHPISLSFCTSFVLLSRVPTGTHKVGTVGTKNREMPIGWRILFQGRDQTPRMALPETLLPGPASVGLSLLQCGTGFPHKVRLGSSI